MYTQNTKDMIEQVLIEPYWNVKEPLKQLARKYYTVLIEPYWNVKIFPEPKK